MTSMTQPAFREMTPCNSQPNFSRLGGTPPSAHQPQLGFPAQADPLQQQQQQSQHQHQFLVSAGGTGAGGGVSRLAATSTGVGRRGSGLGLGMPSGGSPLLMGSTLVLVSPPLQQLQHQNIGSSNNNSMVSTSSSNNNLSPNSINCNPPPEQAKYKTTICRNWESSGGACMFRGCTFAHGVDDLRAPGSAVSMASSPGSNGNGATPVTMVAGDMHNNNSRVSPTTTAPSNSSRNNSFNSSHTVVVHDATAALHQHSIGLMDALAGDVARMRALHQLQLDAGRTLDVMLAKEQASYRETLESIRQARQDVMMMEQEIALKGKGGSDPGAALLPITASSSDVDESGHHHHHHLHHSGGSGGGGGSAAGASIHHATGESKNKIGQPQHAANQSQQQADVRALLQSLGAF